MLVEGLVGVTSLIAAASLYKADYFAINVPPAKFAHLGMTPVDLNAMMAAIGEDLRGRTAGSVSLAVGIAKIFSGLPGMKALLAYWYHFIVMFEAVFILTTVDAGTRVARFLAQETLGRFDARFLKHDWKPGIYIASGLVVVAWGAFLRTGSISTLWPMLGIANQLLATTALCVGTTVIVNAGRARYALVTLVAARLRRHHHAHRRLFVDGEQLPQARKLPGLARRLRVGGADVLHRRRARRLRAPLDSGHDRAVGRCRRGRTRQRVTSTLYVP